MRIMIGSPEGISATGNWVTASRYCSGLAGFGHQVILSHLSDGEDRLAVLIEENKPDLLLLIHAYRTGRQWLALRHKYSLPTVVMLSGTDLNNDLLDKHKVAVVEQVMNHADALLSHNKVHIDELSSRYPQVVDRLHYIPPGIELGTAPFPLRQLYAVPDQTLLFLCPASVRPVKGLVELMQLFDLLQENENCCSWQLYFCGPILDEYYAHQFFAAIEERAWAHYIGVVSADAMAAAMIQVDVVVNNSSSEGLPNALIEAASLGVPILARDIVGNRPIVEHGINGLLYADESSFLSAAQQLVCSAETRYHLGQVRLHHYSPEIEAKALNSVSNNLFL